MKHFYFLIVATVLVFTGCKKEEGCTNVGAINFDAKAEKDDGTCQYNGKVTFYNEVGSGYGNVDVFINGNPIGTITLDHTNPACGENGAVTFTAVPGAYAFTAQEESPGSATWSGVVNITSAGCTIFKLQ